MKNSAPIFKNERSLASAGSGKTYALTRRFIALSFNCAPERICALTFTRKAAGEFLDRILSCLADAALDEKSAAKLSAEISELAGGGSFSRADFLRQLEKVVEALPRLKLSTIDAFCALLTRVFAAELGVLSDMRVLDAFSEKRAKTEALYAVLDSAGAEGEAFDDFAESLKQASMGKEGKSVLSKLLDFADAAHEIFLDVPDLAQWGNPHLLGWAGAFPKWDADKYLSLRESLEALGAPPLKAFANFLKNTAYGSVAPLTSKGALQVAEHYASHGGKMRGLNITLNKKTAEISAEACAIIEEICALLIGSQLGGACRSTAAIGGIISEYERAYNARVRLDGRLSFSDMAVLLSSEAARFEKSMVEYRLDSAIDHWLFDEFQDTSRRQWAVFENLVDEVLQDDSRTRTFYYVGDVKQSIYRWRGGAPDLFSEIFEKYKGRIFNAAGDMNVSWRSVPVVIDAVNGIFGDESLLGRHFCETPRRKWLEIWRPHKSEKSLRLARGETLSKKDLCGCVGFVSKDKGRTAAAEIFGLVQALRPLERGLTCAVLVQKNSTALKLIEEVRLMAKERGAHLPIAGDLDVDVISDSMCGCAIRQFFRLAAHPADSAARKYLEMTPLCAYAEKFGEGFSLRVAEKIGAFGFAGVVREVADFLKSEGAACDEFSARRLSQIEDAAREFDLLKSKNTDDFLEFISAYKMRDSSEEGMVQVMSYHKAKGLDFDIVILPDLGKGPFKPGLEIVGADCAEAVMNMPPSSVCAFSETLTGWREVLKDDERFDSLCKFYVGITRAKRALYFIKTASASDAEESDGDFSKLLYDYFDGCADAKCGALDMKISAGSDPDWAKEFPLLPAEERRAEVPHGAREGVAETLRLVSEKSAAARRVRPSQEDAGTAEEKFECAYGAHEGAAIFGERIHAALSRVERAHTPREALSASLGDVENAPREMRKLLENMFSSPQAFEFFNVSDDVEVWREKNFEMALGGNFVGGVFDRVLIFREGGRISKIRLVDFKSDSVSGENWRERLAAAYARQLGLYAAALSRLTGAPLEKIECAILPLRAAGCGPIFISSGCPLAL